MQGHLPSNRLGWHKPSESLVCLLPEDAHQSMFHPRCSTPAKQCVLVVFSTHTVEQEEEEEEDDDEEEQPDSDDVDDDDDGGGGDDDGVDDGHDKSTMKVEDENGNMGTCRLRRHM